MDDPIEKRAPTNADPPGSSKQRPPAQQWPPKPAGSPVAERAQDISNFPDRSNLSYSYVNPYPSKQAIEGGFKVNYVLTADFATAADLNPGGDGPARVTLGAMPPPNPDRPTKAAPGPGWKFDGAMKKANSPNHGGFGQNVLYGDGHVQWQPTPFCGGVRGRNERDNIYARHRPSDATEFGDPIVGPAMDANDTVLLPTAAPQVAPAPAR